ncbi:uncharacterized protein LOC110432303 [Sorghum bicolor]|uniref:uncharacterized protein LOC110432303 n=1 Tax=Sorghum bicolor TaxID=4558 RepID=UPI000B426041|nr:uncharacterized protein LOC110432303 [Sorghum bicolor]|eukprot:XP_021308098.1 uncharacterized protein LOC110432303 [Sorghum bicolor]
MASSSIQPTAFSLIGCPVTEKLAKNNYSTWSTHVLSAIRGARLAHFLDAKTAGMPARMVAKAADKPEELISNPDYDEWVGKDQTIFNYLYSSVSKDVQVQVSNCTTSAEMWKVIQDMNAAQSRGRVINTRMALAHAQKGSSIVAEFFSKMKGLANDMAAAGKKLDDEEVASYILAGLDTDFDPVVSSMSSRVESLTLGELYSHLVSWEQRMDLRQPNNSGTSVNTATRGGRGGSQRGGGGGRGGGFQRGGGRNRGRGNHNNNRDNNRDNHAF